MFLTSQMKNDVENSGIHWIYFILGLNYFFSPCSLLKLAYCTQSSTCTDSPSNSKILTHCTNCSKLKAAISNLMTSIWDYWTRLESNGAIRTLHFVSEF